MSTAVASAVVVNHRILNLNQRKSTVLPASSSSFISIDCPPYRYRYDGPHKRNSHCYLTGFKFRRPFSPVMEWQDCTVKMEMNVPTAVAYKCYSDREAIPQWMPFISSVKILEDKPDLSRWSLKYKAFGRDIEFSWLARNMQPIPNQKIHWRSLEGLPNRGIVRFFPKGASSCMVELTVSYEVPQLLIPVASVSILTQLENPLLDIQSLKHGENNEMLL
ncbi:Hypothetical predicted protein [Olea europaea subsp. europaea]|uniref:Coenzyme Q-binding protein COQ10 START domain-containing protein n=1 Tax=Olea europaea subsp. europaea TaxID=158383 RepID=A0A8S0PI23_OLEEU|nr:Hypothetical predicted protein [Olea europaea subsp. europaea]